MYPDFEYSTQSAPSEPVTIRVAKDEELPLAGKIVVGVVGVFMVVGSVMVPLAAFKYLRN